MGGTLDKPGKEEEERQVLQYEEVLKLGVIAFAVAISRSGLPFRKLHMKVEYRNTAERLTAGKLTQLLRANPLGSQSGCSAERGPVIAAVYAL